MRHLTRLLLAAPLLLLPACGGTSLPDCTGAVTVTASSGLTPSFSWNPKCQLEGLVVTGPSGVVWSIEGTSQTNSISPPVRYGSTPGGARLLVAATALTAGASYQVTVSRFDDGHGGTIEPTGGVGFVP